jgi:hypothetical protein
MSNHFDYFKEHPSAQGSNRPLSYKYGYLLAIIKGVMFMNNKQQIKNALMEALEHLEKEEPESKENQK